MKVGIFREPGGFLFHYTVQIIQYNLYGVSGVLTKFAKIVTHQLEENDDATVKRGVWKYTRN